jgi:hypothetical protein
MSRLCRISDAGNTYNYALTIIKNKGYKIFLVPDAREEFLGDFWAIKDRRDFIAADPLRLLALINIWEELGDEWYTKPTYKIERLYNQIIEVALYEKQEIMNLQDLDFQLLVDDYQILFEALNIELPDSWSSSKEAFGEVLANFWRE